MLRRCTAAPVPLKSYTEIFQSWPQQWTADQWDQARIAAKSVAQPSLQTLLCACKVQDVDTFKFNRNKAFATSPQALSPGEYFRHRCDELRLSCILSKTNQQTENKRTLFVCSKDTFGSFRSRRVLPEGWAIEPLEPKIVSGHDPFSDKKVTVLAGESGSGKTTKALMSSDFGVYLLPTDFMNSPQDTENLNDEGQENKRNAAVVKAVTEAVAAVVAGIFDKDACLTKARAVCFVLDEFGRYPVFIRGVCAARDIIRTALKASSLFSIHEDVVLRLIVVGTGTDVKEKSIGSHPDSFVAVTMLSNPAMLKLLETLITNTCVAEPSLLLEALRNHTQARHLIRNPRFAALFYQRIVEFHNVGYKLFTTKEQALLCLDAHIIQAARDFRELNAMGKKDHRGVEECFALALALLFRPAGDGTTLRIDEHNLFTSAGVLTDDARWHCNSKPLPDGFVRVQGHPYVDGIQLRYCRPFQGSCDCEWGRYAVRRCDCVDPQGGGHSHPVQVL